MNKFPGFNTAAKTGKVPGMEQSSSVLLPSCIVLNYFLASTSREPRSSAGALREPSMRSGRTGFKSP